MADTKTSLNPLYGHEAQVLSILTEWGNNIDTVTTDSEYLPYYVAPWNAAPVSGIWTSNTSTIVYTCATWAALLPQLQSLLSSNIITETSINTKVDNSTNETIAGIKTLSSAPILSTLTASTVLQSSSTKEIESSSVTNTELGYVSGVTSAIQTQINTNASNIATNTSDISDNAERLPLCEVTLSGNQTSGGTIIWTAETSDDFNMHDLVTNPERVTIPSGQDGDYEIIAALLHYDTASSNVKADIVTINGSTSFGTNIYVNSSSFISSMSVAVKVLSAGDYIEVTTPTLSATNYIDGNSLYTYLTVKRIR